MEEEVRFCEQCGKIIWRGGFWIDELEGGVCFGPCERELCGDCGNWDDEGCCPECHIPEGPENPERAD
jgi:hypothetical protein